ncbi:MAG: phosphatidate cytidylyltransferase [Flavobacteriales bacterium]
MKEIGIRAATGAVYVGLTLLAAWAGPLPTLILFLPVCAIAAGELHNLLHTSPDDGRTGCMTVAGIAYAIVSANAVAPFHITPAFVAVGLLLLVFVRVVLLLFANGNDPGRALGADLLMIVLIAVPFALLAHLVAIDHRVMIGIMILLWTNETGAYLSGKFLGKHKMMPVISPKKTWEGLIGGVFFTLLFAWLLHMAWPFVELRHWLTIAVLVAVLSTVGDLLESALKRARGVKDAGNILPGHGGILDRFDGLLLVAPGVWAYLLLVF